MLSFGHGSMFKFVRLMVLPDRQCQSDIREAQEYAGAADITIAQPLSTPPIQYAETNADREEQIQTRVEQ